MNTTPLVSVIIPTYNRADKLPAAIESVYNQTYTHIQLLVIDDDSKDTTPEIMKKFPQAEYIRQQHGGQATARNNGLRHAKGSIIASLDSDDMWNPDFLERCVNKLEAEQLDFVFANWAQDSKDGKPWNFLVGDPFLKPFFKETPDKWITITNPELRKLYLEACPSPSSSVVMRKSSIVNGWDEQVRVGDDWCMYLDMILNKKCRIAFTLDQLWRKRIDEINIYDGRKRSEVLKYLFIQDTKHIMNKFAHLLTPEEMKILERRFVASSVELAKHELFREHNLSESFRLIRKSAAVDLPFTLKMIPDIVMQGLKRKLNKEKKQ